MAWRFKASKYKNAAPIVPKPDACIRDICVGSYQTYGNNIAASAAFMAFNVDHNGSSLAVLPIDDCGRKSKTMPLLHAHSDTITDMDFSPFHDGLLATGSLDCLVKIWHIPEQGLEQSLSDAECTFSHRQRRVDTVGFHPTADFLLTTTSCTTLSLWDLIQQQQILTNTEHPEVIQSLSWKKDGSILATSCKDKQLRILDPRQGSFTHSTNSHQSIKDSRVTWLGDHNRVLTTGFDSNRQREVFLRDLRNFDEPEKTLTLDSSTGILIPLFDPDTSMLFLAGKGDTSIQYLEVTDREPFLVEGLRHNGEQTKGACLVPKRALNVMVAEVNRVLQLTGSAVIPIMYQVPRKSYRDFHADLFPETSGNQAQITATQWIQGHNVPLPKINLDPNKRSNNTSLQSHRGNLAHLKEYLELHPIKQPSLASSSSKPNLTNKNNQISPSLIKLQKNQPTCDQLPEENGHHQNGQTTTTPPKPLPRSSRTNSFSEEEASGNLTGSPSPIAASTRPIARPRTTTNNEITPPSGPSIQRPIGSVVTSVNPNAPIAGGYKPRLGPKPFTPPKFNFSSSSDEKSDFSFDQVFSVPNAPETMNGVVKTQTPHQSPEQTPSDPTPPQTPQTEESEPEQPIVPEAEPDSPEPAKTPSTAERRKLFEKKSSDDDEEKTEDFDRLSSTRSSIAERRKMYESRSLSVQDAGTVQSPTTPSPQPPRRRESFKKPDESSRPIPTQRQHTLDQCSRPSAPTSTPSNASKPESVTTPTPKRTSTVFGRVSKFRHLKGTTLHKSTHIENIRNISRQISGECDGFHANPDRVAVPLSGPGGKMAVFELKRTGKLPDGVIPALVHGTNIMDFAWDPFDNHRLAVACDDGSIKLWLIPDGGLIEPTNEPKAVLNGHIEKIYFIKWHPTAKDVLATGSYDMTLRIWDLETGTDKIILTGHNDQMYSLAWSPCGRYCATLSKDQKLRVYQPRKNTEPIREGKGPAGARGARLVWALDGTFLVTIGFDKASERQIQVFKSDDLKTPLNTVGLDVSPAILMPFYDEDSSTLFLTGKGDSTIYAFEITEEAPFICPLSHHRSSTLHQGLSFLPKSVCDVGSVEFARALRLTNNTIEPLSFTVPRIKSELFQDDLFPPTRVTWEPSLKGFQWFTGMDKPQQRISLKPEGMESLSDIHGGSGENKATKGAAVSASAIAPGSFPATQQPYNRLAWNAEIDGATKDKQEQIQRAVSSKMEINMKLEQDDMEGVDEKEWDE